jgi:hypothetical protein
MAVCLIMESVREDAAEDQRQVPSSLKGRGLQGCFLQA